jgi:ABC-type glycerol-3-phosphate transport system permease component
MGPVYALLVAGVFKIFGIYSTVSAYVILSLNCVFAALTCFPLRFIASTAFGKKTAIVASWAWTLFPYSFDFAAGQVWNTSLATLLFVLAVAVTIALERRVDLRAWVIWGVVWAIAGLTEPSLLAGLPVAGLWLCYGLRQRGAPWNFVWRPTIAALAFLVVISPWFIRNERVFGRFIPFRSNFWLTFYQGNTWDTFDVYPDWANPPHNQAEMDAYARLGEVAYMAEKKQLAIAEVREHPARFVWTTLRRIVFTWTGYWNLSAAYRRIESFAIPNIFIATLLSAFAGFGLARAFSCVRRFAVLFAGLLLVFPAVYYITHPSMLYRHPVDPFLILLSVSVFIGLDSTHKPEVSRRKAGMEINA